MLDSRCLSPGHKMQNIQSSTYTTRIIIMRKRLKAGHTSFDGDMGVPEYEYYMVIRGYPAIIVPVKSDLKVIGAGQIDRGDFVLTMPYKKQADGGLLLREKDIVTDMGNPRKKLLVICSHDPADTHLQICADLQDGVVSEDLARQG